MSTDNFPSWESFEHTPSRAITISGHDKAENSKTVIDAHDIGSLDEMWQWLTTAMSEASSGKDAHIIPPSRNDGDGQKDASQVSAEEVGSIRLLVLNREVMASTRNSRGLTPYAIYNNLLNVLGIPRDILTNNHGVIISHHLSDADADADGPYLIPPVQETAAGTDCRWPWKYKLQIPTTYRCAWVYIPSSRVTVALLLVQNNNFTFPRGLVNALDFVAPRCNPVFLAYGILEYSFVQMCRRIEAGGKLLGPVFAATGYHPFKNLATGNPEKLSMDELNRLAEICMRCCASAQANICELTGFLDVVGYLDEENQRFFQSLPQDQRATSAESRTSVFLKRKLRLHRAHIVSLRAGAERICSEGQGLAQGIQNLLARKQQDATHEISQGSKAIAEASLKDTTSMTGITTITMLFLPATFTATLFSTQFFSEVAFGGDMYRQGVLYAGLTLPLTVVVLAVWYGWTSWRRQRNERLLRLSYQNSEKEYDRSIIDQSLTDIDLDASSVDSSLESGRSTSSTSSQGGRAPSIRRPRGLPWFRELNSTGLGFSLGTSRR